MIGCWSWSFPLPNCLPHLPPAIILKVVTPNNLHYANYNDKGTPIIRGVNQARQRPDHNSLPLPFPAPLPRRPLAGQRRAGNGWGSGSPGGAQGREGALWEGGGEGRSTLRSASAISMQTMGPTEQRSLWTMGSGEAASATMISYHHRAHGS